MATPIIQSTGSVSGIGVAGEGRNDLVPGETVTLIDADVLNIGAVYFWEFDDAPIGTAPTMIAPTTATPSFVVNASALLAGSYRVRCTVNGLSISVEVLAVPLATTGARIPSFEEETQYDGGGNTKGWHEAMTVFMRTADATLNMPMGIGGTGDLLTQRIVCGGRESHNSDTPLVVGAFAFNPNLYSLDNTTVAFTLEAIVANGSTPLTTHLKLYNVTDSQDVTSSIMSMSNSTTLTKYTATLIVGSGAGMLKDTGEKLYECRIYLDVPPGDPLTDSIELYKAELKATFTVT